MRSLTLPPKPPRPRPPRRPQRPPALLSEARKSAVAAHGSLLRMMPPNRRTAQHHPPSASAAAERCLDPAGRGPWLAILAQGGRQLDGALLWRCTQQWCSHFERKLIIFSGARMLGLQEGVGQEGVGRVGLGRRFPLHSDRSGVTSKARLGMHGEGLAAAVCARVNARKGGRGSRPESLTLSARHTHHA